MAAPPAREGWDMRRFRRYFLSISAGGLAFSVRAGFDPLLLDNAPFVFFLPAVLVACFFLGRGPAALTTGLGLVLGDVFFQPPRGTPTVAYDALAEGLAYLIVAFLIIGFWPARQRFTAWLERAFLDLDPHRAQRPVRLAQANTTSRDRRLAAILAADVAGYSRLMGQDDEGTLAALKELRRALVDPKIDEHRGRIVKTTGDGALVEYASPVEAVRCAAEIQSAMSQRNVAVPADRRIEFRIGINVGDVIIDGADIFGDGVNVAARLEGIAKPGGISLSEDVYRQVRGKIDIPMVDAGEQRLKNIANPVRVYRIEPAAVSAAGGGRSPRVGWRWPWSTRATAGAAIPVAIVLAAVGWFVLFAHGAGPSKPVSTSAIPMIVVLPFANQTGDEGQDYFVDGVTQEVINALGRFNTLRV